MNLMKQSINDTIERVSDAISATIENLAPTVARLIAFGVCVGICVIPFALLQHPERPAFWYSLAAYGVYLAGAAQLLR